MLSHHHKTIFVHIPKCAGQSIEMAFLADIGLTWATRAPLLLYQNERQELGPRSLAHLTAIEYVGRRYVPQEMFDAYFKFSVVRNPWSRTVSLYRYLQHKSSFRDFVLNWLPRQFADPRGSDSYWFVRPATEYLFHQGQLLVDEIIHFESLDIEFERISNKCGISRPLPHINRSAVVTPNMAMRTLMRLKHIVRPDRVGKHRDWISFYDTVTTRAVAELYRDDAAAFKYCPPDVVRK